MNKQDILLMEGAYNSILLKSKLANLTVKQLELVIENASTYELDVLEELFGAGMKNLFSAGKQSLAGVGDTIKGAAQGAGRAIKAGAGQVGQNVKNIYKAGENEAAAVKRKEEVAKYVKILTQQLEELKAASPKLKQKLDALGNIEDLTIKQIMDFSERSIQSTKDLSSNARDAGFFKGVAGAAASAYNKPQPPQP
jgi:DNA repair protein RadC